MLGRRRRRRRRNDADGEPQDQEDDDCCWLPWCGVVVSVGVVSEDGVVSDDGRWWIPCCFVCGAVVMWCVCSVCIVESYKLRDTANLFLNVSTSSSILLLTGG